MLTRKAQKTEGGFECRQVYAKIRGHEYSANDVYLHTAPLYHVGGLVSWLAMLKVGASHVLMPRYSPQELLRLASEQRVSAMIAVPAVIADIIEASVRLQCLSLTSFHTSLCLWKAQPDSCLQCLT